MAAWEKWALAGILTIGAGSRLSGLELGWFMGDQVRDAVGALQIVEGKSLPLAGPVVPGLYALGPLYYYLLAIPFGFSKDPSAAVLFISLLSLVSVYLTYRLGRDFFGLTVGLVGAALYAARALWNPGLIPFFTVVFFYCLYHFLVGQRPWGFIGASVALGCLLQIHLSGLALLVLLVIATPLCRRPFPWWHTLVGLALVVVLFSSYLVFETRRGFQGISDALQFLRQEQVVRVRESSFEMPWKALRAPFALPIQIADGFSSASPPFLKSVQNFELVLFVGGLMWVLLFLIRCWERSGAFPRPEGLLLLWIAIPLLTLTLKKQALMWYYFDVLYPSQFLVIGHAVDGLLKVARGKGIPRPFHQSLIWAAILGITCIISVQGWFLEALRRDVLVSGTLRLPTQISLRFPDPLWWIRERGFVELMPLKYKRELTAALLDESPMDEAAFYMKGHGSAFEDLIEDKGYFFQILQQEGTTQEDNAHYVVARRREWSGEVEGAARNVGPFWVVKYRPAVQYAAWRYAREPGTGWFTKDYDASGWAPALLPARNRPNRAVYAQTPLTSWGGSPVYYRGWIEGKGDFEDLHLVIALRDLPPEEDRHRVGAFYLNGRRLDPFQARSYLTPLTRSAEMIFKVGPLLEAGPNLTAFEVVGTFPIFDMDVYEVRWKGR
ncbi:MAG: hypothetical protein HYZ81_01945 [Nitrospinae bacterium]|nr:hypothetical protein [Nitrospinota bacterium]